MKLAAVDIGTNSVKLLVADADAQGALSIITERAEVTRLGEGVDKTGRLAEDAMTRTLNAVAHFAKDARGQGAQAVLAVGTSALRDAANGTEFLAQAKAQAGVDIEIITGEREAELAYAAVHSDPALKLPERGPLLVFDIGGGSTELIAGDRDAIQSHRSLQIGAVRITERHLHADPHTQEELDAARVAIRAALHSSLASDAVPFAVPFMIGLGGTAVNIASVTAHGVKDLHGTVVTRAHVQEALHRFVSVPLAERKTLPGLEPARADVIIGGALILDELLARFGAAQFTVSVRGLRFGLLAEASHPA